MIRSMTGWGDAERETSEGRLRVEIRTVNHRYFDPRLRLPSGMERHASTVEGWLKEHLSRGHVTYTLSVERGADGAGDGPLPELDPARARRYVDGLRRLREELELEGPGPTLGDVVRLPGLFRTPDPDDASERIDAEELREVTRAAVRKVVAHREEEGRRLEADLAGRMDAIESALAVVEERAPARLVDERDRLRERVRELADEESVDEERLAREIAYLADKWDINEELVRYRSHVELFRETLDSDPGEPVGKRLSFLVQEMHREANTIGAKANDREIARSAVALKEEVERLREQVENVE